MLIIRATVQAITEQSKFEGKDITFFNPEFVPNKL